MQYSNWIGHLSQECRWAMASSSSWCGLSNIKRPRGKVRSPSWTIRRIKSIYRRRRVTSRRNDGTKNIGVRQVSFTIEPRKKNGAVLSTNAVGNESALVGNKLRQEKTQRLVSFYLSRCPLYRIVIHDGACRLENRYASTFSFVSAHAEKHTPIDGLGYFDDIISSFCFGPDWLCDDSGNSYIGRRSRSDCVIFSI